MTQWLKPKTVLSVSALIVIWSLALPVYAVGPTEPVGPQGTVGAQGAIGAQGTVGYDPSAISSPSAPLPSPSLIQPAATTSPEGQSNTSTGDSSQNSNTTTSSTSNAVSSTNQASAQNTISANANSGTNTVSDNTAVGEVKTGDINGTVTVVNAENSTLGSGSTIGTSTLDGSKINQFVADPITGNRVSLTNSQTGTNSANTNAVNTSTSNQVTLINNATANTVVAVQANTGGNTLEDNTSVAGLQTGNINLGINVLNILNAQLPNTNVTVDTWSILNNYNGAIVIPQLANANTGSDSKNNNTSSTDTATNLQVTQNSANQNTISVAANSGNNSESQNSHAGAVESGQVNINTNAVTVANVLNPVYYLINVLGTWTGQLLGVDPSHVLVMSNNTATGANSDNANQTNNQTSNSVSVANNAVTTNTIHVVANTGDNTIDRNTTVGDVKTGAINVNTNILNVLNSWSDNLLNAYLGIITIFGNWNGNVSGALPTPVPTESAAAQTIADTKTHTTVPPTEQASTTPAPIQQTVTRSLDTPPTLPDLSSVIVTHPLMMNKPYTTVTSLTHGVLNRSVPSSIATPSSATENLSIPATVQAEPQVSKQQVIKSQVVDPSNGLSVYGAIAIVVGWAIWEVIEKKRHASKIK